MPYRNPTPTVDIIIELVDLPHRPIILIERLNPPHGWALPGGFVDYGESLGRSDGVAAIFTRSNCLIVSSGRRSLDALRTNHIGRAITNLAIN